MWNGSALLAGLAIAMLSLLYGGLYEPSFWIPSVLLLIAAAAFLAGGNLAAAFGPARKAPLVAVVLFALYLAGRSIFGADSHAQLTLTWIAGAGVAYLVGTALGRGGTPAWIWLGVIAGTACLQAGFGLTDPSRPGEPVPHWPLPWLSEHLRDWYERRSVGRMHGFYLNPNHLAWFLNFGAIFCLSLALWARAPRLIRFLLIPAGLGLIWASFQTLSRGGLLALIGGLLALALVSALVLLLRAGRLRWPLLAIGIALAFVAFIGLRFGLEQIPQYSIRFNQVKEESDYRENVWKAAWRQFQAEPVQGTGPGSFEYYGRIYRNDATGTDPLFAHNDWLQFAAEYGVFGLVGLGAVLIFHLASGIGSLRQSGPGSETTRFPQDTGLAIRLGAIGVLVAAAIHSLFDFNLHLPANLLLAVTALGCLAPGEAGGQFPSQSKFQWQPWLGAVLPLGLAGVLGILGYQWGLPSIRDLQAENALNEKQIRTAREIARLPGSLNPAAPSAWGVRAKILEQMGDQTLDPEFAARTRQMAALHFNQALLREPGERRHALRLATIVHRQGRPALAESLSARAMELDPFYSTPYLLEGRIQEARGNSREARQFYLLAIRLPHSGAQAETRLQHLDSPAPKTSP